MFQEVSTWLVKPTCKWGTLALQSTDPNPLDPNFLSGTSKYIHHTTSPVYSHGCGGHVALSHQRPRHCKRRDLLWSIAWCCAGPSLDLVMLWSTQPPLTYPQEISRPYETRGYENSSLVSLKFRPAMKPGYFWGGVRGPGGVGWPQATSPYPTWEFQQNHGLKSALKNGGIYQFCRRVGNMVMMWMCWWILFGGCCWAKNEVRIRVSFFWKHLTDAVVFYQMKCYDTF